MKKLNFSQILFIFVILIFGILFGNLWKLYPIYGSYLFQDWTYIYDYPICLNDPDKIVDHLIGLCPVLLEYEFVYPEIWLKISEFGSRKIFKNFIIIFIILYLFISLNILKKYKFSISFFYILSPVSILLLQRGNNDLIIFSIIYLFYLIIKKYKNIYYSLIPLFFGIILKIYPITLIPIFYFIKKNIKKNILFYFILIIITLYSFYLSDFLVTFDNYNKAGITLAFNSAVLFKIWNYVFGITIPYKTVSVIILFIIIYSSLKFNVKLPETKTKYELSFLIGSAITVSSFFLNEGFVYKLTFIVFTIPLILEYHNKIKKKLFVYLIAIIFLSLWAECLTYFIEIIFDANVSDIKDQKNYNFISLLYGFCILIKNIIYWLLNINLIFLSSNLIFRRI